ncbi:MAG: ribosome small subunit-dependent GTPase A [Prevotella sp.]|nr:ribosome small subunit-dependent GTPase A [Prevotella sp.]
MKGLVIKNTGSWYTVRTDGGQLLDCKIKGNFRLKGIRSTNPVAVGDRVEVLAPQGEHDAAFITAIEDRRNYIIRKSINLSKQSHILAANVDQALLVVTVVRPETSTTFIDRFLASAEAYRVPVVLAFNKTDLLDDDERRLQQMMVTLYETVGYHCLQISAATGSGLDALRPLLNGKITLLSGNSGVGKSTLINRLVPDANLRTAEISDAHNTGMHTTTFSEMIPIGPALAPPSAPEGATIDPATGKTIETPSGAVGGASPLSGAVGGAYLIDTPGIKGFGTFDMEPEEISGYFKEIFRFSKDCRFSNCTHTHEPGCAVLRALDDHLIAQSRYQSYVSMLNDKDESKYREAY